MWTSSRTRLRRLEASWQQPASRSSHFPWVARYYDHVQHEPAYYRLPDQTWEDLNGDLLFELLDATVSRVGQQCLYHRLRSPLADESALHAFDAAATLLAQQPVARGLRTQQQRSFVPRTIDYDLAVRAAPNRLLGQPAPTAPHRVWVGDITYLPRQGGGWLYLAVWLNRCSRKIVGWDVREAMPEDLVSEALRQALVVRQSPVGLVIHSEVV
ncbi:hypothetical protein D0N36_10735 [Hymenobacter lapidiphilus]|uniref:DDE-type integrase/transposase/recombinase n=1 Tax=Hymenobacter sp. CCM 8763 TaxID=2303334 RepID=UPI000E3578A0|nr:DDE-type integrase/transposase/recombinase [Hymenobacter sp. CCM 8763]RFP65148.1 hypothetical protein D0N36_10735 [Hymenobacter sp. CCM 8763]